MVALLLLTLQISGVANAAMGDCVHSAPSQRHAPMTDVAMSAGSTCHLQHALDPHHQHSSHDDHCSCLGLCAAGCAGGLTALGAQPQTIDDLLHQFRTSSPHRCASAAHPLDHYRPPIAAAI